MNDCGWGDLVLNFTIKMKLVNTHYENECTAGADNAAEVLNLSMKK